MTPSVLNDYLPVLPEAFLVVSALALLIAGAFTGNRATRMISQIAIYCVVVAGLILAGIEWDRTVLFGGMFVMDEFAGVMKLVILAGVAVSLGMSIRYLYQERINRFEYPFLVLFAGVGMMLMVSANNLLALYVGLELQSLCLYALAAFHRDMIRSAEAGLKYFVLGALSSGMTLFGISLVYGLSGSLGFEDLARGLAEHGQGGASFPILLALVFILAGVSFKITAAPFHMWAPDVYHGAPTSATAFFAIVPKVAAMSVLIRLLFDPFQDFYEVWGQIVYFLSVASMFVGAFAALVQVNIKRLMAYSAIGHIGYALIGVAVGTQDSVTATLLYLAIYSVMAAGTFAVILVMRRDNFPLEDIADLSGLAGSRPFTAYAMVIMMFSLSGIPPLAGFFAKFSIFQTAIDEGFYVLAVIGVVTTVVAAFYYLRVVKVIMFDELLDSLDVTQSFSCRAAMLAASLFALLFWFYPQPLIVLMDGAAATLLSG